MDTHTDEHDVEPDYSLRFNPLDKLISIFSPKTAFERASYRAKAYLLNDSVRQYDAASHGRRTAGWVATGTSANREIAMALPMLRFRSREQTRNNPYAKRAIQSIAVNTTGLGIRPVPKKPSGKGSDTALKALWDEWADATVCDYDGQSNFYGIQHLMMRCISESGEVLVRRRRNASLDVPFQLQVLEPDFLDHYKDTPIGFNQDGTYTIQGIQFDSDGKRTGYWLYSAHPGEGAILTSTFVPAEDVLHVYYKERPGQVRGVPSGVSTSLTLRDFEQYEQAQLIRQKIASCFAIFVTDPDVSGTPSTSGSKKKMREKVEPGIIEHLPAGKSVTMANPPGVQNYDEYSRAMLRKIAAGFGITYEILSGDLSNVNFSSGRMGWIEFHRLISVWQSLMFVPMFCQPVWSWFTEALSLRGKTRAGAKADWTPPRREMIDPVKETKAMAEAIRNGLGSWQEMIRQNGQDPETVLGQIIEDFKRFDKAGVLLDCNPSSDVQRMMKGDQIPPDGSKPNTNAGDTNTTEAKK